jgi:competence protein ComEC
MKFSGLRRSLTFALFAVLFSGSWARSARSLSAFEERYFQTVREIKEPSRCSGRATVTQSPILRSSLEKGEMVAVWSGVAAGLDCEGRAFQRPIPVRLYGGPKDLARGDEVEFVAQLAPTRLFRNAGLPSPWPGAARRESLLTGSILFAERATLGQSLISWIDRKRARVRERILATYSPLSAPLARALVLGESDLDAEDAEAFRNSGLLHLLAVSGTHLVIAVVALVQGVGALLVRIGPLARRYDVRRASSLGGALLSLLYADFSGGSGSAWRAAFMLCLVCGGRALGLRIGGAAALGSSILIGLVVDPLVGSDYSFLLSALATSGLIGLGQPLTAWTSRGFAAKMPIRPLVQSLTATLSSTLPCAPVLSMMDGDMTWAALFANVVAGPMGELIALPACLVHTLTESLPWLERGLALVGSGALYWVRSVALLSASAHVAQFPVPFPSNWDVCFVLCALCCWPHAFAQLLRIESPRARVSVLLAAGALGCLPSAAAARQHSVATPPTKARPLTITALDVEQGDALLVHFPDGKVALVDAGGFATGVPDTGARVVLPVLRARGIKRLDLIVLSHPHPDHMMGLVSVTREIPASQVWIPGLEPARKGPLRELLENAQRLGAKIETAGTLCGARQFGGVEIEILSPCSNETRQMGANDASLVLRLKYGARRALLTGDIERDAEAALLREAPEKLRTDFLKVAHHGSDTSSTAPFLKAARPTIAFISSGVRNRYDHPRKSTLQNLAEAGIFTLRTDRLGSLTWHTDGRAQWLSASDVGWVSSWTGGRERAPPRGKGGSAQRSAAPRSLQTRCARTHGVRAQRRPPPTYPPVGKTATRIEEMRLALVALKVPPRRRRFVAIVVLAQFSHMTGYPPWDQSSTHSATFPLRSLCP